MTVAIQRLASFIHELSLSEMPADVTQECKRQLLDAVTAALGAHRIPSGVIPARTGVALGGQGTASIVGMSERVVPTSAALANAQMAVALDMGSNLISTSGLAGVIVFSAIALGELVDAPGSRVLEAIACGFEVAARIRLALPPRTTWEPGEAAALFPFYVFGSAAASAKILALEPGPIEHCLALAAASAAPPNRMRFMGDTGWKPSMVKYGLMGNVAVSGITAAMLAREGFTGDRLTLDDAEGYYRSVGTTLHNRSALTEELGEQWWIREAHFKRYPAGTHNQQVLQTLERLLADNQVSAASIEAIEIRRAAGTQVPFVASRPANYIEAQFSLPFQIGALAAGVPRRDWLSALNNPVVERIAGTVRVVRDDPSVDERDQTTGSNAITTSWRTKHHVRLRAAGKESELWSEYERVSDEELCEKFRHFAFGLLMQAQIEDTIAKVLSLDRLAHISSATSLWGRAIAT